MKKILLIIGLLMLLSQVAFSQKIIIHKGPAVTDTTQYYLTEIDSVTFRPTLQNDILYDPFDINPIANGWKYYANETDKGIEFEVSNSILKIKDGYFGEFGGGSAAITKDLTESIDNFNENFYIEVKMDASSGSAHIEPKFGLMDDIGNIYLYISWNSNNGYIKYYLPHYSNFKDQLVGVPFANSMRIEKINDTFNIKIGTYTIYSENKVNQPKVKFMKAYIKIRSWISDIKYDTSPNDFDYIRVMKIP